MKRTWMGWAARVVLLGIVLISAADPAGVWGKDTRFLSQMGGAHYAVYVEGTTAYMGQGPHLVILDVANPSLPVMQGSVFLPGVVEEIFVTGGWAYIAAGSGGFHIVDVGNPAQPALMSTWKDAYDVFGVFAVGNLAYVVDEERGLLIFNVSNPASPTLIGSAETIGEATGIFVSGTTAYVADGEWWDGGTWVPSFQIFDVIDPTSPVLFSSSYIPTSRPEGVYVDGTTAYLAIGFSGLEIVDVSNPASPAFLGAVPGEGDALDVFAVGNLVYLADDNWGLKIYDVSNPATPQLAGEFQSPVGAEDVFVVGSFAYLADWSSGLQIIEVIDPASPLLLGTHDTVLGGAGSMDILGNLAYVDAGASLQIVDVGNPQSPVFVSRFDISGEIEDLQVIGTLAYLAADDQGLQIIDVSNPSSPGLLGVFQGTGQAVGVSVVGGLAFLADGWGGLQIVDVSNPSSPTLRGAHSTGPWADGVFAAGGLAYVAAAADGLQIFDVRDPSAPVLLGIYATQDSAVRPYVVGDLAYVVVDEGSGGMDWDGRLEIIDVSDPTRPRLRGAYPTRGISEDVQVVGDVAYVTDEHGLLVLDVAHPSSPTLRGAFDTGGEAVDVVVADGLTYVTDADSGFWILQFFGDAPRIGAALIADVNANGVIEPGDKLVLTLDRGVVVSPGIVQASHFFLPVSGDSLGGAGFAVDVNPLNSRQILLTLGSGAQLTAAGVFSSGAVAPGAPSGIDFAASLPFGAITSLDGVSVTDGGAPGVDDSGMDVEFTMVEQTANVGAGGGTVSVVPSLDAAYTQHELTVPAGGLATTTTFTLREPPVNLGVTNAYQIQSSDPVVTFTLPATVSVEYQEGDIDWELGQIESEMRVHQLVENPIGVFQYELVPGIQTLTRGSLPLERGSVHREADAGSNVSVPVSNLNPNGSVGTTGVFAGIPIETVDERSINVKPSGAPIIQGQAVGPVVKPGPRGAYTLHQIEFPGYVETTAADPARIVVTIRTATLAERLGSVGGQSFPTFSGAIFVVTTEDASGQPVAFTDPVNVTVQFKEREPPYMSDWVRFNGVPSLAPTMYLVRDDLPGEDVDFEAANASPETVDTGQGMVTGENVVGLTGSDGRGTFGVVARSFFSPARHWSLYP